MKKRLLIVFSIVVILLIIDAIFICMNLENNNTNLEFESSQINSVDSNSLNIIENIENEIVNEFSNETIVAVISTDNPSNESTNIPINISNEKTTIPSTTNVKTTTKDEIKSNTKVTVNNNTNNKTETKNEVKQEIPSQSETTPSSNKPTSQVARPELANSTYRVVNNDIIPEVIKILNDEISKYDDLVSYGCKALKGNKTDAYAKTSGFTYLWVKEIEKGKVKGNYTTFSDRVRNTVGGFANYNVYAEDEFTYNSQGLNPKWSQTLVWIYLTF